MANRGFSCFETHELPSARIVVVLWQLASKGLNQVSTSVSKSSKNSTQHRGICCRVYENFSREHPVVLKIAFRLSPDCIACCYQ